MTFIRWAFACGVFLFALAGPTLTAQTSPPQATIEGVRSLLTALAADSMEGRGTGTQGSVRAANLLASEFRKIGLEPAGGGSGGGFFQNIPYGWTELDSTSSLQVGQRRLAANVDFTATVRPGSPSLVATAAVVFGGSAEAAAALSADQVRGRVVLLLQPAGGGRASGRGGRVGGRGRGAQVTSDSPLQQAAAIAYIVGPELGAIRAQVRGTAGNPAQSPTVLSITDAAASAMLGRPVADAQPGTQGSNPVAVDVRFKQTETPTYNVLGLIRGSDPTLRSEYIVVDAHYDHLGIGRAVNGDSIYNGADDDASGTVAVVEIARALAQTRPARSILFAAMTGEEVGLVGTGYFIANPTIPFDSIVANFEIEMIGRPDSLAGGPGKGWLTGFERSTMGETLARAGLPIVADPRPAQNFFSRSDNIAFARAGIVAHTLSSFNLHEEYHSPADDVSRVDFEHMTTLVNLGIRAVSILANGPRMTWHPGGQPGR